jgi:hypothetical protein
MKKLRQANVEPVLGTLINFMGIRRIWTRCLRNANKFMLGTAVANNLKKWLNYGERKTKTAVMALKRPQMDYILISCAILLHRAAKFKIYIAICIYLKNKTGCKHRLFYFL